MIQIWRNLATKPEGTSVILQATLYPAESLKASARHWSKANLGKISIRTLKDGRLLCTLVKKPGSVKPAPSFDGIVTLEAGDPAGGAAGGPACEVVHGRARNQWVAGDADKVMLQLRLSLNWRERSRPGARAGSRARVSGGDPLPRGSRARSYVTLSDSPPVFSACLEDCSHTEQLFERLIERWPASLSA
jgi:hypothetical protein